MQPSETPQVQPTQPTSMPTPGAKKTNKTLVIVTAVLIVIAIAVAVVWFVLRSQGPQTADLNTSLPVADVAITPEGFGPGTVQVQRGQEVTWTNNDSHQHSLTADQNAAPNLKTPQTLNQGDSYTYVFSTAGTYRVYDPQNPKGYTSTIVVE